MNSLFELMRIRKSLKTLANRRGVLACKDPTMLFSGLLWGEKIFVGEQFMRAFWPLKVALFQYGDHLIEAIIKNQGLQRFKDHYMNSRKLFQFYLFDLDQVSKAGVMESYKGMRQGYQDCATFVRQHYSASAGEIMNQFIAATHKAIESVFFTEKWSETHLTADGNKLWELVCKEEKAKNVAVVMLLLEAARPLEIPFSLDGKKEELLKVSSRWFTLIDDWLDLKRDVEEAQPNYLTAILHQKDEWHNWSRSRPASLSEFKKTCPNTLEAYNNHLQQARRDFQKTFPVIPWFFTWWIEREARIKEKSPF